MGDLSAHFSRSEFACKHCGVGTASPQLLSILEALRAIINRPISPQSGFRCRPHNDAVEGANDSRHMYGDACDLAPALKVSVEQARRAGAVGIGTSKGLVTHIDWRPGAPARWTY